LAGALARRPTTRSRQSLHDVLGAATVRAARSRATLAEWLPPEATLFVASSMPVRDVETWFGRSARPAAGALQPGRQRDRRDDLERVRRLRYGRRTGRAALIGDVALAHDIGGLLAASRLGLALTVVLLNNDGGGIFHFLPVARERTSSRSTSQRRQGSISSLRRGSTGSTTRRPNRARRCETCSYRHSPRSVARRSCMCA
jgi:hypothetical protein